MMTNAELITELRGHIREVPLTLLQEAADALEAAEKRIEELEAQEPTEKQVVDYCHKRCLVIVEGELFQRMKSTFSQRPKEGEWIDGDARKVTARCSVCGHLRLGNGAKWANMYVPFCEICGAKMKTVTDCHTL